MFAVRRSVSHNLVRRQRSHVVRSFDLVRTTTTASPSRSVVAKARSFGAFDRAFSSFSSSVEDDRLPAGTMTKVVCTLGPATDAAATVATLVDDGMSVARVNMSHTGGADDDREYANALLERVRGAPGRHASLATSALETDADGASLRNVRAVLVDTKGPEIRTGPLQNNEEVVDIAKGASVEITTEDVSSDPAPSSPEGPHRIQVDYVNIAKALLVARGSSEDGGRQILLDDGLIALEIDDIDVTSGTVHCTASNGGPIKKNKGVNLPNTSVDLPALTDKDKADLRWACEVGADYVAASFIRTAENARSVIAYLERCMADVRTSRDDARKRPLVVSKIENKEGLDNFHAILRESEGIMVARGDLGVEIPYRKVFAAQKMMVSACNEAGKPVIVATQMLDSMQRNPRPTRAEVTDVGTAVLDGADAVMLSGETAAGAYPVESVRAMVSIVAEADAIVKDRRGVDSVGVGGRSNPASVAGGGDDDVAWCNEELHAMARSAVRCAEDMNVRIIVLITTTGTMARAVARQNPTVPVLAFCTSAEVARRLQLYRGVVPLVLRTGGADPDVVGTRMGLLRAEAVRTARELGHVRPGDRIVFADRSRGKVHDTFEYSHNIKLSTLRDGT